jgi:hypothetical protein
MNAGRQSDAVSMQTGLGDLSKAASAYLACLAFVVAFLVTTLAGGTGLTAALRGALVAAVTLLLAPCLVRPFLTTIFDAIARDRIARNKPGDAK